jgi:hypothetical protein
MAWPIRLFQAGDVVLNIYNQRWHGYSSTFGGAPSQMLQSDRYGWRQSQYFPAPRTIQISGSLIGDSKHSTAGNKFNALNRLAGRQTDIIAYTRATCCEDFDCGCGCGYQYGGDELIWLHTRGMITKVESQDSGLSIPGLAISIAIGATWRPLNRLIWSYRHSKYANRYRFPSPATPLDAIKPYPTLTAVNAQCDQSLMWVKRVYADDLLMYDPSMWEGLHQYHRLAFEYETGYGENYVSDSSRTMFVRVSAAVWSARPSSVYAFTNLPASGQLSLWVRQDDDPWTDQELLTTVSLDDLDAELVAKGYGGLLVSDSVYIGDTRLKPGLIVRSGAVLSNVAVPVDYDQNFPGILGVGTNRLIFDTPAGSQHAQVHTFRRL